MFESIKHWVAIGGAVLSCPCPWLPIMAETLGGPPAAGTEATPGACWLIFSAEAAYSGIWNPVPENHTNVNLKIYVDIFGRNWCNIKSNDSEDFLQDLTCSTISEKTSSP